jgi:hypothetical protein
VVGEWWSRSHDSSGCQLLHWHSTSGALSLVRVWARSYVLILVGTRSVVDILLWCGTVRQARETGGHPHGTRVEPLFALMTHSHTGMVCIVAWQDAAGCCVAGTFFRGAWEWLMQKSDGLQWPLHGSAARVSPSPQGIPRPLACCCSHNSSILLYMITYVFSVYPTPQMRATDGPPGVLCGQQSSHNVRGGSCSVRMRRFMMCR